jgi:Ino eighty subunit 1
MQPWEGVERADIMYMDQNSALTNLLIDKGYLTPDSSSSAGLQYYIEVKTTMGACVTPFYMSNRQFKMVRVSFQTPCTVVLKLTLSQMQEYSSSNANSRCAKEIYVIFRVFNLGSDSIGLKVLVDPESIRQRGEIEFTAKTWSVVARE